MVSYYLSTPTRCRVTPCQESFTRMTAYVSPAAGDIADVTAYMNHLGQAARAAATRMRRASTAEKNRDRKSTRLNSSHVAISYAVFCLKKKNRNLFIQIWHVL